MTAHCPYLNKCVSSKQKKTNGEVFKTKTASEKRLIQLLRGIIHDLIARLKSLNKFLSRLSCNLIISNLRRSL